MLSVNGYEGLYTVDTEGNVWSYPNHCHNGKFLRKILRSGYHAVNLSKNGKATLTPIHRIVAIAFIGNPNNLPEVNHKDLNKLNNNVLNLEWITSSGNRLHRLSSCGFPKTERFLNSVRRNARIAQLKMRTLSNEQVLDLRKDVKDGMTYKIARIKYGINQSSICDIIKGRTYKEIL